MLERSNENDVAIIGLACRTPGAENVSEFWDNLANGRDCISRTSTSDQEKFTDRKESTFTRVKARGILSDIDKFDASFFNISNHEANMLDPQHRIFLECAYTALEDASYDPWQYSGNISVYASCGVNYYLNHIQSFLSSPAEKFGALTSNVQDSLSTLVSHVLNLRGESIAVQTACSSSLTAVHLACRSLQFGDSDIAICGGANVNTRPDAIGYEYQEGMIYSQDGYCRPFDKLASGTVESDGVAVVILKRLQDAIEDGDHIYATILGSAVNNDGGEKASFSAPSVTGQSEVIAAALTMSQINPDTIGFVEAHGTGTKIGDSIEVEALTRAYRLYTEKKGFCALGSVKSNLGHLVHASGIVGLLKLILSIYYGKVPPTVHYTGQSADINFKSTPFFVNTELIDWVGIGSPRRAAINSLGVGGTNVHMILESERNVEKSEEYRGSLIVALSGKNEKALIELKKKLKSHITKHPGISLLNISFSLNVNRHTFSNRWSAVVENLEELVKALSEQDGEYSCSGIVSTSNKNTRNTAIAINKNLKKKELFALAKKWASGFPLNWNSFYHDLNPVRIPLPTYPFQKQSYWIGGRKSTSSTDTNAAQENDNLSLRKQTQVYDWYYELTWQEKDCLIFDAPFYAGDVWLILLENGEQENEVTARLRERGIIPILVQKGDAFGIIDDHLYKIAPDSISDYEKLFFHFERKKIEVTVVINFWLYGNHRDKIENQSLLREKEILELFYFSQAVFSCNQSPKIIVVTSHAQYDSKMDLKVLPSRHAALGFIKVLGQERPDLKVQLIDFGCFKNHTTQITGLNIAKILTEIDSESTGQEVMYIEDTRYVQIFKKVNKQKSKEVYEVKDGDVLLVTGGLGKVGLEISKYFSTKARITIILTTRKDRSDLLDINPTAEQVRKEESEAKYKRKVIKDIRSNGGTVIIRRADVTDSSEMEQLVQDIEKKYGYLTGVIHAAGVAEKICLNLICDDTTLAVKEMLAPKMKGVAVLADVLKDRQPKFCISCSSLASHLGGTTYGSYTAANRFMDAYINALEKKRYKNWISINYDTWAFDSKNSKKTSIGSGVTEYSMTPDEGNQVIADSLEMGIKHLIVSTVPLSSRIKYIQKELFQRSIHINDCTNHQSNEIPERKIVLSENDVKEYVNLKISGILGIDEFSSDDDLFSLGVDSFSMLELVGDCENKFGIKIKISEAYDASNVAAFISLCCKEVKNDKKQAKYAYEMEVGDELATIVIDLDEYKKSGAPDGAINLRPYTD